MQQRLLFYVMNFTEMLLKYKGVTLVLLSRRYTAIVRKAIYVKVFKLPDNLETAYLFISSN